MGVLGDRISGWVDLVSERWKDRLRGWMASWLSRGTTDFLESSEPSAKDLMRDTLSKMLKSPGITPEMRKAIESSLEKGDWVATAFGYIGMVIGSILGILAMGEAPGKVQSYAVDRVVESFRLDPISVITAWRRDQATYEKLFDDLKDQGWNDDRIEALKFVTLYMPSASDIVHWYAREVYEPEMIDRYGLDSELPTYEETDFPKIGVDATQARHHWMAHWEHASYMQIREMLHRGVLSKAKEMPTPPTTKGGWTARDAEGIEAAYDWYRLVEIPPFWRARLTEMMFEVPTRVDVRRWWDMRTISEQELYNIYHRQGYHGTDLDNYVLWTKVYTAFPDLITRLKNGWITLDDVRKQLKDMGMPEDRIEEMIQTKIKPGQAERTAGEKDLTKTDIIKGVKTERITRDQGVELLMDIGYDEAESIYILAINIPEEEQASEVKKRELTKADVYAGLKEEILTDAVALAKLGELRYTPDDAQFLLKIFKARIEPPTELRLKEASKADIVLAVKKGLITSEDGYLMLLDINFSPEAAEFILAVRAETSPFSPVSYSEFKALTTGWRKAVGMEAKPMPEELKQAADEVVRITKEIESLKDTIKTEEAKLVGEEVLPAAATAKVDELRVTLHRAEAALAEAKSRYDSLLAQWRHKSSPA